MSTVLSILSPMYDSEQFSVQIPVIDNMSQLNTYTVCAFVW